MKESESNHVKAIKPITWDPRRGTCIIILQSPRFEVCEFFTKNSSHRAIIGFSLLHNSC
jgi:hypothetical protein